MLLDGDARVEHSVASDRYTYVQVARGEVALNGAPLQGSGHYYPVTAAPGYQEATNACSPGAAWKSQSTPRPGTQTSFSPLNINGSIFRSQGGTAASCKRFFKLRRGRSQSGLRRSPPLLSRTITGYSVSFLRLMPAPSAGVNFNTPFNSERTSCFSPSHGMHQSGE